jgi:glycosyltransferase involved in cell wall biosynthesis
LTLSSARPANRAATARRELGEPRRAAYEPQPAPSLSVEPSEASRPGDDETQRAASERRSAPLPVLLVTPQTFFRASGTPISVVQLCRVLVDLGHPVELLSFPHGEPNPVKGIVHHRSPSLPLIRRVPIGFSKRKALYDAVMLYELRRLLRGRRYAAVHLVEEAALFGAPVVAKSGTPIVVDVDSDICAQLRTSPSWVARRLELPAERLRRRALGCATCVVTVTSTLTRMVREIVPQTPIFEIKDFAFPEAARAADQTAVVALRRELGLEGRRIVLYTGNLQWNQGVELLVEGFARLTRHDDALTLLIVGGEPGEIARLASLAGRLGIAEAVRMVGHQPLDVMPEYMALADVLVSPRIEPLITPLKIYAYMASGRPIVATDLPTHREVVDDRAARLVPPTADGLADGIAALLADPDMAAGLGAAAKRLVDDRYSWASFRRQVDELYAFVTTRHGG